MKWINSNGGPLILSSKKSAELWSGIRGSSISSDKTDYERACAVSDYIEVIQCGDYDLLVLGDEPMQSGFFSNNEIICIARWVFCESPGVADVILKKIPNNLIRLTEDKFIKFPNGGLIIFDSALSFSEIEVSDTKSIDQGIYRVTTELFKPEKKNSFIIHRLIKVD